MILDFIKGLVIPKYTQKFRFMTVFVSILIFVLSCYLVILPTRSYYKRNTDKLINDEDLAYLQVIRDIPNNESKDIVIKNLKDMNLFVDSDTLNTSNIIINNIEADDSFVGVIKKNNETNTWLFNDTDTTVTINDPKKVKVDTLNNGIYLDNVNNKVINIDGINEADVINIVTISNDEKGRLLVNENILDYTINKLSLNVKNIDNKLVINDFNTSITLNGKTIILFIPKNLTYFETSLSYINNDIKKNVSFIIDLDKTVCTTEDYKFDTFDKPAEEKLNEEYYFITITKNNIFYQANLQGIDKQNIEHNSKKLTCYGFNTDFAYINFDLRNIDNSNFNTTLLSIFSLGYQLHSNVIFSVMSVVSILLFTLIIAFIMFLLFRKNGKIKTFKEFYNIASIANIIPVFITFIICFFNPSFFYSVYLALFSIYYLFMIYKINSIVDIK